LKNHYFILRSDKSVYSLVKLLLQHVFPEQEQEYVELSAKAKDHRLPREPLPTFLHNRPKPVISACLSSIQKAKAIDISTFLEIDKESGTYKVCSKNGEYLVDIKGGNCTCPYYTLRRVPCKHMFCIFQNFSWTWSDLPLECTQCPHMTLDNEIDKCIDQSDLLQDEQVDVMHNDDGTPTVEHSFTLIPQYRAAGSRLLCLQKQLRDELAKCTAAVFMIDDISTLETLQQKVHSIHLELLSAASTSQTDGNLSTMKQLMKEEVTEFRKKSTVICRANQVTKKYSKIKRKVREECPALPKRARPAQKDDPLQAATHASVGRPKGKKHSATTGTHSHRIIVLYILLDNYNS